MTEALTPRQRRHLRTKDAILDAARQIIATEGAEKLSMRAIAKRIDYSPAGLYEYFGSKDVLTGNGLMELSPSEELETEAPTPE